MKRNIFVLLVSIVLPFTLNAKVVTVKNGVDFITPKNNQTVKSPFKVKMKVSGMKIKNAGEPDNGQTGHHHLLINGGWIEKGQLVPADETHLHFGKGQTETKLTLEPGEYNLILQFADGSHKSYGEEMSKTIHIKVIK